MTTMFTECDVKTKYIPALNTNKKKKLSTLNNCVLFLNVTDSLEVFPFDATHVFACIFVHIFISLVYVFMDT